MAWSQPDPGMRPEASAKGRLLQVCMSDPDCGSAKGQLHLWLALLYGFLVNGGCELVPPAADMGRNIASMQERCETAVNLSMISQSKSVEYSVISCKAQLVLPRNDYVNCSC